MYARQGQVIKFCIQHDFFILKFCENNMNFVRICVKIGRCRKMLKFNALANFVGCNAKKEWTPMGVPVKSVKG